MEKGERIKGERRGRKGDGRRESDSLSTLQTRPYTACYFANK